MKSFCFIGLLFSLLLTLASCKTDAPKIYNPEGGLLLSEKLVFFPRDTGYSFLLFKEKIYLKENETSVVAYGLPYDYRIVKLGNTVEEISTAYQIRPITLIKNFEKVRCVAYKKDRTSKWSVVSSDGKIVLIEEFDPMELPRVYTLPLNRGDDRN